MKSGEFLQALQDPDLPFAPMVLRRRPPITSDLIVKAATTSEEDAARYHLRSRGPALTKEQFLNLSPQS